MLFLREFLGLINVTKHVTSRACGKVFQKLKFLEHADRAIGLCRIEPLPALRWASRAHDHTRGRRRLRPGRQNPPDRPVTGIDRPNNIDVEYALRPASRAHDHTREVKGR